MKLVYAINFFGYEVSGVQNKILSQVKNLNNLGLPSAIYSLTGIQDNSPPLPYVNKIIIPDLECQSPKGFFAKLKRNRLRDYSPKKIIETLHADEILYTRMLSCSRITSKILKASRKCKIVIEYQSIEPNEIRLAGDYLSLLFDFLYGDDVRKYTDGIVGVTDEITRYQLVRSGDPQKPHITIGNGFNVGSVTVRRLPPFTGRELHLLCVANVNPWHGLDRLIRGMGTHHGSTRIILHIAGDGSELSLLKKISDDLEISDQVIFHGLTTGKDLDETLQHVPYGDRQPCTSQDWTDRGFDFKSPGILCPRYSLYHCLCRSGFFRQIFPMFTKYLAMNHRSVLGASSNLRKKYTWMRTIPRR